MSDSIHFCWMKLLCCGREGENAALIPFAEHVHDLIFIQRGVALYRAINEKYASMASGCAGSGKTSITLRAASTLGWIIAGTRWPCKRKTVTMQILAEYRPSRLQRPAVCSTESNPASSRQAAGKSTSTPASIREVDTTRQGKPLFSLARISFRSRLRSAGQEQCSQAIAPL